MPRTRRLPAMILALVLPLLVLVGAAPAAAAAPTLKIKSVTLVAKGAGVRLDFVVTCDEGSYADLRGTITQAAGNRIANGSVPEWRLWDCTGQSQPLSVLIPADVAGAPFHTGEALLLMVVYACPGANCEEVRAEQVVRIVR
ncbi:hypothetical protein ACLQ3D_21145 [Micromonospora vinacea]|uniref:Uncharacterized protein (DUF1501 family) n=1 Tax=Micromonospora vinacea TaxID=709878 RepID=A0ABS0JVM4_9ACTN|nr:hypothetical protein [Micromonospora vinacea]MBG6099774.1 uncharacterized protein (DUF1501 family) [Micromonospora vinacea]WSZ77241.1 hypothetical protein OH804_01665 [Micromonospora sp. NBC_00860]WTA66270.1 hypothetical protein OHB51_27905 [Micromonospora sp. NBC_00855]